MLTGYIPETGRFQRFTHSTRRKAIPRNLRPAALFTDIDGLEIDNFKPQVAKGVPAAVFAKDVKNLIVRESPLIK